MAFIRNKYKVFSDAGGIFVDIGSVSLVLTIDGCRELEKEFLLGASCMNSIDVSELNFFRTFMKKLLSLKQYTNLPSSQGFNRNSDSNQHRRLKCTKETY